MSYRDELIKIIIEEKMSRVEFLQKEIDKEFAKNWFVKMFRMRKIRKMMKEVDGHMDDFFNPYYLDNLKEENRVYIF